MAGEVDYRVVQQFNNLWHEASIQDVANGQTSGINKEEFDGMSLFLNSVINDTNSNQETRSWAQSKLGDLSIMMNSQFNQTNIKSDIHQASLKDEARNEDKSLWDKFVNLFKKNPSRTEESYVKENLISYDTMLVYNGGGIEAVQEKEKQYGNK